MDAPHAGVDGPPRRETPPIAASVAGTVFVRGRFPAFPPACRQRSLFLVVAGAIRRCSIRFTVRSVVMFMRTGSAGRRRASAVLAGSHRSPPPRTVYTLYTVMCLLCTQWIVRERERERGNHADLLNPSSRRMADHVITRVPPVSFGNPASVSISSRAPWAQAARIRFPPRAGAGGDRRAARAGARKVSRTEKRRAGRMTVHSSAVASALADAVSEAGASSTSGSSSSSSIDSELMAPFQRR